MDKNAQTALITGASSGIGYELAKIFAREGYNLVLVARGETALQKLADELKQKYSTTVTVIAKDLSQADAPQAVADQLAGAGLTVEVLVNNAGFADYGLFAESDLSKQLEMIQLNIVTLTHLTRLLLPAMLQRKSGKILNLASTAAFQPGPLMSVYYATKAYVLSFSEALANEVKAGGVTVTALCPGATESGFQQRAAMEDSKLVKGRKMPTSAHVAEAGYKALMQGKTVFVPGLSNKALTWAVKLLPRRIMPGLVRSAQERSGH